MPMFTQFAVQSFPQAEATPDIQIAEFSDDSVLGAHVIILPRIKAMAIERKLVSFGKTDV